MNTNSNSYTIGYAAIMVIIVAFLLAFVSSSLKEMQTENVKLDTKKQILSALNITEGDAAANYESMVKDYILNPDGSLTAQPADSFQTKYADTTKLHVFECLVNGEKKYVFPVRGAGLWGPIWGYVALNDDKNTVYGTYFGHEGETPGLGAEIAKPAFSKSFLDKIVSRDGNIVLSVVKNGKVQDASCEVDGISGGTITSTGVNNMLQSCLTRYKSFLSSSAAPAVDANSGATKLEAAAADSTVKAVCSEAKDSAKVACVNLVDTVKKVVKEELNK